MKAFYIFLLMVFSTPLLWGQAVEYKYDTSGNRIQREKIISLNKSVENGESSNSAQHEVNKVEERYEDLVGQSKITIYPNPTQGLVKVEFENYQDINDLQLHLYDTQGQLLQRTGKVTLPVTLDLSDYPSGVYILWITVDNDRSQWKIVKTN